MHCKKLKIYTINFNATTKMKKVIVNKMIREIKGNNKKCLVTSEVKEKEEKRNKKR